jgi:hypothetical protein
MQWLFDLTLVFLFSHFLLYELLVSRFHLNVLGFKYYYLRHTIPIRDGRRQQAKRLYAMPEVSHTPNGVPAQF